MALALANAFAGSGNIGQSCGVGSGEVNSRIGDVANDTYSARAPE